MRTRTCNACGVEKSIRGVWYLMPAAKGNRDTPFRCEACFQAHGAILETVA